MPEPINRRAMLKGVLAAAATTGVAATAGPLSAADSPAAKPPLRKAVKFGMIGAKGDAMSVEEKFALIKRLGFEGVEMDSPSPRSVREAVDASKKTGVEIHGVVGSKHWKVRHSDPDPKVRAEALEDMRTAIKDCQAYGGTTVLLVPGKVTDPTNENFEQVWERSTEQVRQAIPAAKAAGVRIAVEVVWNDFLTTSDMLVKYVDQFGDPTVGAYFDTSNMLKYGEPSAAWIRKLGKRMLKFDLKGYSKEKAAAAGDPRAGFGVQIGEGSEDWPAVLKALDEVGYEARWATAEVAGGDEARLREIAARMDKVLGLKG